jgi:Cu(I)/Ag(I) efflux system membrane protein CusA/SilA
MPDPEFPTGTGADLMKRIAAPMVGGLVTSFLIELLVYPPIYFLWRHKEVVQGPATVGLHGEGAAMPAGAVP